MLKLTQNEVLSLAVLMQLEVERVENLVKAKYDWVDGEMMDRLEKDKELLEKLEKELLKF